MTDKCPNCEDVELAWTRVKDIDSGDVLITCAIWYCPKCLYVGHEDVDISN